MKPRIWWAWLLGVPWGGCATYAPVLPPVEPPPVVQPPDFPPPPPPTGPLPPIEGFPAVGTSKVAVIAAWGPGGDLPENSGEDDVAAYVRSIDGRDAEVHVIFRDGKVFRVVVTYLVTPGGG